MKEEDIRPAGIFQTYLALCEKDIKHFFIHAPTETIACPACGSQGEFSFSKHGFSYELCPACFTLFVSPRPCAAAFDRYYKQSESAKYWASVFYRETAENRRKKIWKPKAELIFEKMNRLNASAHAMIDIGGGFGIFAQEMEKVSKQSVTVIEPGPPLAEACREKGVRVIEKFFHQVNDDELPGSPRIFVSFELFEHLHDPGSFLEDIHLHLSEKDLFVFTTLSGQGIDILTLWDESKSVFPPHHLNFFNPGAIKGLLENKGFRIIEISTPGRLDVDILCQHATINSRFWERFHQMADESTRQAWQETIAATGWSSHMMVVCEKER